MAELAANERLLPSLLDRLTDLKPQSRQEGRDDRVVGIGQYRAAVLRDMDFLLNTVAPTPDQEIEAFPEVASSVLNYGVRDVSALTSGGDTAYEVERRIKKALARFEPRISPESLEVNEIAELRDDGLPRLAYRIEGELWAEPVPQRLQVMTVVDLDKVQFQVESR